jgi:TolB-like protein
LSELKRRNVLRVAATYLGSSWLIVHVGTVLGETFEPLHHAMPAIILVLAAGLPVVLVGTWFLERTPDGFGFAGRADAVRSSRELTARRLDALIIAVLIVAVLALLADRWWLHRPTEQSMLVLLAVMIAVMIADRIIPRGAAYEPTRANESVDPSPVRAVPKSRVAILPFENLSPDPANAFFTDGLHEEILSTLARRARGLEVISRTTMMSYRRTPPKPLSEVRQELAATHVLEGTVRRESNQVRLTVQLIDCRTDGHLWSQNYDRVLADALTLQSEVAGEVAAQLSVHLSATGRAGPPTHSPEAYDFYLKARLAGQMVGPASTAAEFQAAEELLTRALACDPSFAAAYAERAGARLLAFAFNFDSSEEMASRIREDLAAARRLAADESLLLAAEGQYQSVIEQAHERALTLFRAADALGLENLTWSLAHAFVLVRLGRVDEALQLGERLRALDPGNPILSNASASHLAFARQPAVALRIIDLALERSYHAELVQAYRDTFVFQFTGKRYPRVPDRQLGDFAVYLGRTFDSMLMEHRYAELRTLLRDVTAEAMRMVPDLSILSIAYGVGMQPVARFRGWVELLLDDRTQAETEGRAVLAFVSRRKEHVWNRWHLRLLAAEGHLFTGQSERAIQTARQALELAPRARDFYAWLASATTYARICAWGRREDAAVGMLEELVSGSFSVPPGGLVADPRCTVPLANNARYRQLVSRLEAQMRATELELSQLGLLPAEGQDAAS